MHDQANPSGAQAPTSSTLPPHIAALGDSLQDLLSPKDLAAPPFNISTAAFYAWKRQNRLGFGDLVIKLGRSNRIRRLDLLLWLESRKGARA